MSDSSRPTPAATAASAGRTAPRAALELRSYGGEVEHHRHGHHQIVLPIEGRLSMEVEGQAGQVADPWSPNPFDAAPWGAAAFVRAGRWHAFSARGENRFLVFDLSDRLVGGAARLDQELAARVENQAFLTLDPATAQLVRFLALRLTRGVGDPAAFARQAAGLLLQSLRDGLGDVDLPRPEGLTPRLQRVLAFLARNYGQPLTVATLAKLAGLSISHFHQVFRSVLGRTPQQYLLALRLAEAERRLLTSAQPLVEIAMDCGFSDQSALTRAFRREKAITPAALRRRDRRH
tara:strand:+ start:1930 stop:2802 length:873 start_codon:yes stop_codon:yes gene_type:complete